MDELMDQLRQELLRAAAPTETATFSSEAVTRQAEALRRRRQRRVAVAGALAGVVVVAAGLAVRLQGNKAVDLLAGPPTSASPVADTATSVAPVAIDAGVRTFEGLQITIPAQAGVVAGDSAPCPTQGVTVVVELGSARCPATADREVIRLRRVSPADELAAASCRFGGVDQLVGCTYEERWRRTTFLDGGLAVDVELVPRREESGVAATISSTVAAPGPYVRAPLQLDGGMIPPLKPGADPALVAAYAGPWSGANQVTWVYEADNRLAYLFEDDSIRTRVEFTYGYDLVKGAGTWWTTAIQPG